jgi:hypothetical protein
MPDLVQIHHSGVDLQTILLLLPINFQIFPKTYTPLNWTSLKYMLGLRQEE